jgi:type IV pilus assembly protein PilA
VSSIGPVRARIGEERGFTLVELLIVILIIGVLAEIAIPAFLGQAAKANDAVAKSALHAAQTAIETYRLDHGDYCGAQRSDLIAIEATLVEANVLSVNACGGGDKNAYTLSVTSKSSYRTCTRSAWSTASPIAAAPRPDRAVALRAGPGRRF